jgi:phage minor structural protein
MQAPVVIYDLNMNKVAYLENAFNVGYEKVYNALWKASFTLPLDDPKNSYCNPLWYAEVYDGRSKVGLFRIVPASSSHDARDKSVTYELEHVLATLLDSVMFGYHEIGNLGTYTREVLEYILSFQKKQNWQLGDVEFERQFLYKWENENLYSALLSVPEQFDEEYQWTWDTASYPWTLNLKKADNSYGPQIRYRRNMEGVEVEEDPTNLFTRIYPLGYGEGINQLTIEKVNPTGEPYIDADTIEQFGVIERIWVDKRYERAESLYSAAKALLEQNKIPRISIKVSALDLFRISLDPVDKFTLGKLVRVHDEELDLDYTSRVVALKKADTMGDPGDIEITISTITSTMTDRVTDLANHTRVSEVYAQGATSLDSYVLTDNCDPQHPARFRFHISPDVINVNRALLNYEVEPFRAYSRSVAGGGGFADTTADGGGYTATTASGGAHASTTASGGGSTDTTASGGGYSSSTASGGGYAYTTYDEGDAVILTPEGGGHTSSSSKDTVSIESAGAVLVESGPGDAVDGHTHLVVVPSHSHNATTSGHTHEVYDHTHVVVIPAHSHIVQLQDHTHGISIPSHVHSITIPNHTHGINIPDHTHGISIPEHRHSINIPTHTHDIEYGIYEGPMPTAVTVKVDGNVVQGAGLAETDLNILEYLSKDASGKIVRGWHELEVIPDTLGRVQATLHLQTFIQSRGEATL